MKLALTVMILLLVLSSTAHAEDTQKVTVTWSPIHLVLPVVELEAEFSPAPHVGGAVILGAGQVSNESETITATVYEAGLQFNYYFMDNFSGLHAGAEVVYAHVGGVDQDATATGLGLSAGPYGGYKLLTSIGFTFVAQLGAQVVHISAENSTDMKSENKVGVLLNLNIGWSF
jgi:hypothetical protein